MNTRKLLKEIKALNVKQYDIIISDFEPVSCWAAIRAKKPTIGLSNQVATLHPLAPRPKKTDMMGVLVLKNYAPTTYAYGFHFKALDKNVFTPIIRKEVRDIEVSNEGHVTVYLPSYSDEKIIKHLQKFPYIKWQVFSKHSKKSYREKNVYINPIKTDDFLKSMASSAGVFCNAGFGTTSEALFLKKKLLVVPMKKQYEQYCNAQMLESMGVKALKKLNSDNLDRINEWLVDGKVIKVNYEDNAEKIVSTIIKNHSKIKVLDKFSETLSYNMFQ